MSFLIRVLQIPAVTTALKALTERLLGHKNGINAKVQVAAGVPGIVAIVILIARAYDPALGDILAGSEVHILGIAALVSALLAYFTPEPEVE